MKYSVRHAAQFKKDVKKTATRRQGYGETASGHQHTFKEEYTGRLVDILDVSSGG